MAHKINFFSEDIILSSQIGDIIIDVDGDFVDISISSSNRNIFLQRFYPFNGQVTLFDVASLIEDEMKLNNSSFEEFTISAFSDHIENKSDSRIIRVGFCSYSIKSFSRFDLIHDSFLSPLTVRRVPAAFSFPIFYFVQPGFSRSYSVNYNFRLIEDDSIINGSFFLKLPDASVYGVESIPVSCEEILRDIFMTYNLRAEQVQILSLSVNVQDREFSCFVDDSLNYQPIFFFKNCFNVWDWCCVPVVSTAVTNIESSSASILNVSIQYDKNYIRSYQVESGPITVDEAECFEQMFVSHFAGFFADGFNSMDDSSLFWPIIFTDTTCEIYDGDNKVNTMKFTYRFSDNRPILRYEDTSGIFSFHFNFAFS